MSWKTRGKNALKNRYTIRALVGLVVATAGGSLVLVEPVASLVCVLVGCY